MASPSVALFATTIFASAFLIFFVQPMVGKSILPWFGGAPAVWLVCVAFYQVTLFFGYGYAHLLNQRLRSSRQVVTHAVLFAAALLVLPVLPDESWKPQGGAPPSFHILAMLASNVGPPFLLLAATGPLLQAWFARAFPGRSPYGLAPGVVRPRVSRALPVRALRGFQRRLSARPARLPLLRGATHQPVLPIGRVVVGLCRLWARHPGLRLAGVARSAGARAGRSPAFRRQRAR
jgi:hypothetical protein